MVNSPEINAITPPGHMIVYLGLLGFAGSEAELAAVLSHELAHNYAHHQVRAVIKGYVAQILAGATLQAINPQGQVRQTLAQFAASFWEWVSFCARTAGLKKKRQICMGRTSSSMAVTIRRQSLPFS